LTPDSNILVSKYIIRQKLAEGGMGEVFLATASSSEGLQKDVVLKRIRPEYANNDSFVKMFIAEASLALRLNHQNVVQMFGFERCEGSYFLAMEYVEGKSLFQVQKRAWEQGHPMSWPLIAKIGAEVARGLHYVHNFSERGKRLHLVHRDVSPQNILLSFQGAVKLTDFGIAKRGATDTTGGGLKGKFGYMSPEQARGVRVDCRTDVFALGVVLWEMLAAKPLFRGDSDVAVIYAVQKCDVLPPSEVNPRVPSELGSVVMRALRANPDDRYQSAREFEHALSHFMLTHARSISDTDLSSYLSLLFGNECLQDADTHGGIDVTRQSSADVDFGSSEKGELIGTVLLFPETAASRRAMPMETPRRPRRPLGLWALGAAGLLTAAAGAFVFHGGGTQILPREKLPEANLSPTPAPLPALAASAGALSNAGLDAESKNEKQKDEKQPEPALPREPEKKEAAPVAAAPAAEKRAVQMGLLKIRVVPWAFVSIDSSNFIEVQGQKSFRLSPGSHTLRLKHGDAIKHSAVRVSPGEETTLEFSFPRKKLLDEE
jgi:serine/threonine-protein kinase